MCVRVCEVCVRTYDDSEVSDGAAHSDDNRLHHRKVVVVSSFPLSIVLRAWGREGADVSVCVCVSEVCVRVCE